jgi:hypothetical protein
MPTTTFLLLFLTTTTSLISTITAFVNFRISAHNWDTYPHTDPPQIWDDLFTKGMSYMYLLATIHFNERRTDLIPDLSRVSSCNKQLEMLTYCDNSGVSMRAARDVQWIWSHFGGFDGLVGLGDPTTAQIGSVILQSIAGSNNPLPIMGGPMPDASLNDRYMYSNYARIVVPDTDVVASLVDVIVQLKFKSVSFVYMTDAAQFAQFTKDALEGNGITMHGFEFTYGNNSEPSSIREAVKSVSKLGLNVIISACWTDQISVIADAAVDFGLVRDDTLWILTYMERALNEQDFMDNNNLAKFLTGTLFLTGAGVNNDIWHNFIDKFDTNEQYRTYINSLVPPHGTGNDPETCENSDLQYQVPPNFFNNAGKFGNFLWAGVYDAVLAMGIALCDVAPTGGNPIGSKIVDRWMSPDFNFTGLSGLIKFDPTTGARTAGAAGFSLVNFYLSSTNTGNYSLAGGGGGIVSSIVAKWSDEKQTFEWEKDGTTVHFRSGVGLDKVTLDLTPPPHEKNLLPSWTRSLAYAELAIATLFCLGCWIWILINREERVVVNGQGQLLQIICLGNLVATWTIFPLSIDDGPDNSFSSSPSQSCMAAPILFSVGFQLALAALLGKLRRIHRIFVNKGLKNRVIRASHVYWFIAMIMIIQLLVLAIWIGVAPLQWERVIDFTDINGYPRISHGSCAATNTSGGFLIAVFIIYGFSLACASYLAYKVKDLPSEFQESQFIGIAVLSVTEVYFIAVPTIIASWNNVIGRFVLMTSVVFLTVMVMQGLIFIPKILSLLVVETNKSVISAENTGGTIGGNNHQSLTRQQQQLQSGSGIRVGASSNGG